MKNKHYSFTFILLFYHTLSFCQFTNLEWAKDMGSWRREEGFDITTDFQGNVYTTGRFAGTVDFDPGSGVFEMSSASLGGASTSSDIFVQKLDANGNFLWAKQFGNVSNDEGWGIAVDPWNDIYIVGSWGVRIVALKLNSDGSTVWTKFMDGGSQSTAKDIAIDYQGNIYLTGEFRGSQVDFNPNTGVFYMSGGMANSSFVFIEKLSREGNFIWAKSIEGPFESVGESITIDNDGNVLLTGSFKGTGDFDPGPDTLSFNSGNVTSGFIQKLTPNGDLIWAKMLGGDIGSSISGRSICTDASNNLYMAGYYSCIASYSTDLNPGAGIHTVTGIGNNSFVLKLDVNGNYIWSKETGGSQAQAIVSDIDNNIYVGGSFGGVVDFDPGINSYLSSNSSEAFYIQKLNEHGNFKSVTTTSCDYPFQHIGLYLDAAKAIYVTAAFLGPVDFDPDIGEYILTSSNGSLWTEKIFVAKYKQSNIIGYVYNDFDQDCYRDTTEYSNIQKTLLINPGNIIVETNERGFWGLPQLPVGSYTITVDTTGSWVPTCPVVQSFTVSHYDSLVRVPSFGFYNSSPCSAPFVSIAAPFLRPGFSDQKIYIKACNNLSGTGILEDAYIIVDLDPLITIQNASLPYTYLGNDRYRFNFNVDSIYPGDCIDIVVHCQLSENAPLGLSLCMEAELFPQDSCLISSLPNNSQPAIPCLSSYDGSFLNVTSSCFGDSIIFIIQNAGDGDMTCPSQVRLYIDGQYIFMDSVQLISGGQIQFAFLGDGRTWRLEVDRHPLVNANLQVSSTIELCGNQENWTPNMVNILPQDDENLALDISCTVVTGSFDPNDKTGYPLGLDSSHNILPNQDIEYLIRFQNTGTDTAFTVVIRDTLSTDFDIFSVVSGVSSHNYSFKKYGPRVLEWTFINIMLPDSNVNEALSHGFVKYTVKQMPNLAVGTRIENTAAIFFDFNPPVITNTYFYTIGIPQNINWSGANSIIDSACYVYSFNDYNYNQSGTYWQIVNNNNLDSLYTLNLTIHDVNKTITSQENLLYSHVEDSLTTYQWLDCDQGNNYINGAIDPTYYPTKDGNYALQINAKGCQFISDCIYMSVTNKQNDLGILVYPNPASTILNINKGHNSEINYSIMDNLGRVIVANDSNDLITTVDIDWFLAGVYYIVIRNNENVVTQKFVKN